MTKKVSQNFLLDRLGNDLMTEKIFVSSEHSAKFGKRLFSKADFYESDSLGVNRKIANV